MEAAKSVANLANFKATEDWWFILPAILFVDVVVIFLSRFYPETFGDSINAWYDMFGLSAVISDVGIIAIGIAITRYVYTTYFMQQEGWSILYFIGIAVAIQLVHDIAFAYGVVDKIPKGHNDMIDVFKAYISGGAKILLADAAMVAGSIGLAAYLKNQDFHITTSLFFVTAYALTYILYTNVRPLAQQPQAQAQAPKQEAQQQGAQQFQYPQQSSGFQQSQGPQGFQEPQPYQRGF